MPILGAVLQGVGGHAGGDNPLHECPRRAPTSVTNVTEVVKRYFFRKKVTKKPDMWYAVIEEVSREPSEKEKGDFAMGKVSMPQGKGSQLHNRRGYKEAGLVIPYYIDTSKTSENVIVVDKDIRQAYREIFGEALQQYNDKQKRSDRKITDYLDHISKSKNGEKIFYEDIVQWGSRSDFQDNPALRQTAKQALTVYAENFEKRNPNLKLIGAYLHMDEASPHLHLDYIPIAHGYKTGLSVRNSLAKAMREMGYQPEKESRKNNSTKLWKENERAYFAGLCSELGLQVEAEEKSDRQSLPVDEYKRLCGEIEYQRELLEDEVESILQHMTYLEGEKAELEQSVQRLQPYQELEISIDEVENLGKQNFLGKITLDKASYELLTQQAAAYRANVPEIEQLRKRQSEADQREAELNKLESELSKKLSKADDLYLTQINLNMLYSDAISENRDLERENNALKAENGNLNRLVNTLRGEINKLKDTAKNAYQRLTNVVKAVGMLKYDQEKDQNGNYIYGKYGISNLSKTQDRLIDGLAEYGARWARADGFPEMAEDMEKRVSISKGIKEIIEPQVPKRSRSYGPEL